MQLSTQSVWYNDQWEYLKLVTVYVDQKAYATIE